MKRALPERKPVRIRQVEIGQIKRPTESLRQHAGDIDDYIFPHMTEKPVSNR